MMTTYYDEMSRILKLEKTMGNIKKRQHYVPRTYLKPFSSSGKNKDMIWAYFHDQKRKRFVAIDDVCVENYLYEHYICYGDGATEFISPNSIENRYMQLENTYRPIIEKIIGNKNDIISFIEEDRDNLIGFMATLLFRHPLFINMSNTLGERFYNECSEWRKEISKAFPDVDDVYFKMFYLHGMLEKQQDPDQSLIIQAMKGTLDDDQLCVFKSCSGEFVTSDAPVVNIYGDIDGLEYDLVGMPISPEYFVAFIDIDKNVSNKVFVIDNEQIMSLNKHQQEHSTGGILMSKSEVALNRILFNAY